MIEMRWYSTDNQPRTLQYRQKIDTTIRAGGPGMWNNTTIMETANYQWSDWRDVPEVHEPPKYTQPTVNNKCPTCGIEFTGSMGYVCPHPVCPTGLGGSRSVSNI